MSEITATRKFKYGNGKLGIEKWTSRKKGQHKVNALSEETII